MFACTTHAWSGPDCPFTARCGFIGIRLRVVLKGTAETTLGRATWLGSQCVDRGRIVHRVSTLKCRNDHQHGPGRKGAANAGFGVEVRLEENRFNFLEKCQRQASLATTASKNICGISIRIIVL